MPSFDDDRPVPAPDADPTGETAPASPPGDSRPTFPSEAESLLRDLKFSTARPAAPPPVQLPHIPNYEFECEIGRGGMGAVYRARHTGLNRTVAVKMILPSAYAAPGEAARFVAEAEAIAAVEHPNVVRVYDLGTARAGNATEPGSEVDGCPYFVMELVEGGSLAGLLKSGGPLAPARAAELIVSVAQGVQAAHDAGIVHRDLKPANILIADSGRIADCGSRIADSKTGGATLPSSNPQSAIRNPQFCRNPQSLVPKVSDFGLAKRLASDLTHSQAVMGTPAYMAPEQAGGKAKFVGPQADVYALGAILYECLTGRPPFNETDPWSLIRQVLEDLPPPQPLRAAGVHRDLMLICLKCLEKEPHHRYPTAAALADDLRRFLAGSPVSVRPIGVPVRLLRWAKKRPAAAALAALGVLLVLVVPTLSVWVQGRLDRRAAATTEAQQREEAAHRARIAAEELAAARAAVASEAQQKEAAAKNAEEGATRARVAAEQLAEARELFALRNKFRNRAVNRPLGWTMETRDELPRALTLAAGDPVAIEELRSGAASALLTPDLFPLTPIVKQFSGASLATDPKSGLVAVGEFKTWGDCRVLLVDPVTGQTVRQLTFPTVPVRLSGPLDLAQDGARALAFSPDGRRLFVGTRSSRVMRFDLDATGNTPTASWKASSGGVEQLAVSPDGNTLYGLCHPERPIFAWTTDTGEPLAPFAPDEPAAFGSFAVLHSGDVLAANGTRLYRWKADRTLVSIAQNVPCYRMAATAGSLLLVAEGARLVYYDLDTATPTNRTDDANLRRTARNGYIHTIAVHPSGAFAATSSGDADRTVKVWELASGQLIGTGTSPGTGPVALAWSGEGIHLLATADGHVARWRFAPAAAENVFGLAGPPLESATFVADDRAAALGTIWGGRRELLVARAAGSSAQSVYLTDPGGNGRPGLSADPSGLLAVTASAPGIVVWKPGAPLPPAAFNRHPNAAPRFNPDGRDLWVIVDSNTVRCYDPIAKAERGQWSNEFAKVVTGIAAVDALAVGRSGAAVGARDGTVYLLDPKCDPVATFRNPRDPVQAIAFTSNEARVVAGTQNGKLRVIRTADKTELPIIAAHPGGVTAIATSRDGALLATGGRDRAVRLWKRSGEGFESLLTVADLPAGVHKLQFSPTDGRLLVLLVNEHAARVWNLDRLNGQLAELKLGW